jgi:hypothetical protein
MTKNGAFPPDFYMFRQSLFLLHSPNQQVGFIPHLQTSRP